MTRRLLSAALNTQTAVFQLGIVTSFPSLRPRPL